MTANYYLERTSELTTRARIETASVAIMLISSLAAAGLSRLLVFSLMSFR